MQLWKESLKKNSGSYGIQNLDLCDTSEALYHFFQAFLSFPRLHVAWIFFQAFFSQLLKLHI